MDNNELSTNLAEVGTDAISREQAIDALEKWLHGLFGITEADGTATIFKTIRQLPPIQPKRGRWILDRSGAYCCSKCMEPCASYVMMKPRDKFCKMCGSRNEVTT